MATVCDLLEEEILNGTSPELLTYLRIECVKFKSKFPLSESVIPLLKTEIEKHCKGCEEYIEPDAERALGHCDMVMDKTNSGCGCAFKSHLTRHGCPQGKFASIVSKRARPTPTATRSRG